MPFLGRIPLLGWLFKYRGQTKTKTNLMVFLRPIIVRNPQDSYGFSTNRYDYMQGVKKAATKDKAPLLDNFKPMPPRPEVKPETKPEKSDVSKTPNSDDKDRLLGPPSAPEAAPESSPAKQP